jgi:hypothetical protein
MPDHPGSVTTIRRPSGLGDLWCPASGVSRLRLVVIGVIVRAPFLLKTLCSSALPFVWRRTSQVFDPLRANRGVGVEALTAEADVRLEDVDVSQPIGC